MAYTFKKLLKGEFEDIVNRVKSALAGEGFGVLTEIDVTSTLKAKLNENFRPYRILGACHPPSAFRALLAEPEIGTMLPCNVVVQQQEDGILVSAIDPLASMLAVDNRDLSAVAQEVQTKLKKVLENI